MVNTKSKQIILVAVVIGIMFISFSQVAYGQVTHKWSIGTGFHYSFRMDEYFPKTLENRLLQPEITYHWHNNFYGGLYGSYEYVQHHFDGHLTEEINLKSIGPLLGVNLRLSDGFFLKPEAGINFGKGQYEPPVPARINKHPTNKIIKRAYFYTGMDFSLGIVARLRQRLDVTFEVRYTDETWNRQPFEEAKPDYYAYVSPEIREYQIFRWQLGFSYRFSVFESNDE